jgi:hypothetical protein
MFTFSLVAPSEVEEPKPAAVVHRKQLLTHKNGLIV